MERHVMGATKIADGALKGLAVVGKENAKFIALGKYVICTIEKGSEFSKGMIVLPDASREKVVVRSVGNEVTLKHPDGTPLKEGDCVLVAQLTKMSVFNPLSGQNEEIGIYDERHIMGVVE